MGSALCHVFGRAYGSCPVTHGALLPRRRFAPVWLGMQSLDTQHLVSGSMYEMIVFRTKFFLIPDMASDVPHHVHSQIDSRLSINELTGLVPSSDRLRSTHRFTGH